MKTKKTILLIIFLTAVLAAVSYFLLSQRNKNNIVSAEDSSKPQEFLASPYNDIKLYEEIFSNLQPNKEATSAKAGIVSHHFLAKELIAEFYNKISSDKISTVFLISPDHYNHFYASGILAYTSQTPWTTPYGDLETNKEIIDSLVKDKSVEISNPAIGLEHGIFTEIPFIKKFFPTAKIIPLVANSASNYNNFYELGKKLKAIAPENSILIVSSDFSHDLSTAKSSQADKQSIDVLKNLSENNLNLISNDCKQCIVVLSGFLQKNSYKFNLIDNKNSFDISGENKDFVTSYVSGFYSEKKDIQILFTGDIMLDRGIRYYADKNGSYEFLFDKIYPLLANQDLVVSNLEGPITNNKSISSNTKPGSTHNFTFTFDPGVAKALYLENIKLVNLGNNHILNFYSSGLKSTEDYLTKSEVEYFGAPSGDRSIVKEIDGIKIAFVSYNEFSASQSLDETQTIDEIQKLKTKADFVIVLPHWGIEYTTEPTEKIKNLAHQFINAGADLIIGTHPHVIQTTEIYNNEKIYYSLGNFIFDQYFDDNVRNGLGVVLKIDPTTKLLKTEEIRFFLQSNGQTTIKQ
jgi:poly-gamma-glutamate synthesis protein (capsule biosynthesis protein)